MKHSNLRLFHKQRFLFERMFVILALWSIFLALVASSDSSDSTENPNKISIICDDETEMSVSFSNLTLGQNISLPSSENSTAICIIGLDTNSIIICANSTTNGDCLEIALQEDDLFRTSYKLHAIRYYNGNSQTYHSSNFALNLSSTDEYPLLYNSQYYSCDSFKGTLTRRSDNTTHQLVIEDFSFAWSSSAHEEDFGEMQELKEMKCDTTEDSIFLYIASGVLLMASISAVFAGFVFFRR